VITPGDLPIDAQTLSPQTASRSRVAERLLLIGGCAPGVAGRGAPRSDGALDDAAASVDDKSARNPAPLTTAANPRRWVGSVAALRTPSQRLGLAQEHAVPS
jgi:hypothetical protein